MKAIVSLFKREQLELPQAVIEMFREVGKEELVIDDGLAEKILNNEDVANSWILSIASSYRDRADLIIANIKYDHSEITLASYTKEKPANYYMIAPKLAKLYRVIYIPPRPASPEEGSDISRETIIKLGEGGTTIYTPPDEYFVYESIIVPKADGILLFEHEYGSTTIDLSEIRSILASSTKTSSPKASSRKSKRSTKKSRKSKRTTRKKRAVSAK